MLIAPQERQNVAQKIDNPKNDRKLKYAVLLIQWHRKNYLVKLTNT